MKPCTMSFLDALRKACLFNAVGVEGLGQEIPRVKSWFEALRYRARKTNATFEIERHNEIAGQLRQDLLNMWNGIVKEVQGDIDECVWLHTSKLDLPYEQQRRVRNAACWDLLGAAVEHEYSGVITTAFHREQSKWYLMGHFVCGWDNHGRAVIF